MDLFGFDNIGTKLKNLAKWGFRVETVLLWGVCVWVLVATLAKQQPASQIFMACTAAAVGPFVLWFVNLFPYAFGELVESMVRVRIRLKDFRPRAEERTQPLAYSALPKDGVCEDCGATGEDIYECVLQDASGTRYKKLCVRCVEKREAQILRS